MDTLQLLNSPIRKRLQPAGTTWTARTSVDQSWVDVAYGHAGFAAAAAATTPNLFASSPDGNAWTQRTTTDPGSSLTLTAVGYAAGTYVAVASAGASLVRTSTDNVTWAAVSAPNTNACQDLAWGDGRWVCVQRTGTGNRVMTSDDNGGTWTARTSAADNSWRGVAFGDFGGTNSTWVAVADTGSGNRVMVSHDGATWATKTSAADNSWRRVAYGAGVFVAVAITGTGTRVMRSTDAGETWAIAATPPADNDWRDITYANGLFVTVAVTGSGNRVAVSRDGNVWAAKTSAADNSWNGVAYGNATFAALASTGSGNRVMTCND